MFYYLSLVFVISISVHSWYEREAEPKLAQIRSAFYEMRENASMPTTDTDNIDTTLNSLLESLRNSFSMNKQVDLHAVAEIVDVLYELCEDTKREIRQWWAEARELIIALNNQLNIRKGMGSKSSLLL